MTDYTREEAIAKGDLAQLVFWSGDTIGDTMTDAFGSGTKTWAIMDYTSRGLQLRSLSGSGELEDYEARLTTIESTLNSIEGDSAIYRQHGLTNTSRYIFCQTDQSEYKARARDGQTDYGVLLTDTAFAPDQWVLEGTRFIFDPEIAHMYEGHFVIVIDGYEFKPVSTDAAKLAINPLSSLVGTEEAAYVEIRR